MNVEQIFSAASLLAMLGWASLTLSLFVPIIRGPAASLARWVIPLILAVLYAALIAGFFASAEGGYGSLAAVRALFATPEILLAGWIHYLAFDLLVGTLIVEKAGHHGVPRILLLPILGLTFLFGPVGLLAFAALLGLTGLSTPKAGAGEPA